MVQPWGQAEKKNSVSLSSAVKLVPVFKHTGVNTIGIWTLESAVQCVSTRRLNLEVVRSTYIWYVPGLT